MEAAFRRNLSGTACAGMGGRDGFLTRCLQIIIVTTRAKLEAHSKTYKKLRIIYKSREPLSYWYGTKEQEILKFEDFLTLDIYIKSNVYPSVARHPLPGRFMIQGVISYSLANI
jgi:hypothetical protein